MREYIYTLLFIFLTCFSVVIAQTNSTYKAKYDIKEINLDTLKMYFDSGYVWRLVTVLDSTGTATIKPIFERSNEQKAKVFRKVIKRIKQDIQKSFDSALDKCMDRINFIKNENANLSTVCIKTALSSYINKLKFDNQGKSMESVNITLKFNHEYLDFFDFNSKKSKKTLMVDGIPMEFYYSTFNINDWKCDVGIEGETEGDGTITIFNGYKDFKTNLYKTTIRGCNYEWYCSDCKAKAFSSELLQYWNKSGNVVGSFEGLLTHEVIHNALKKEMTDTKWTHRTKGRWSDEATVEDIQLKLFPGTGNGTGGLNTYESNFHFAVWYYRICRLTTMTTMKLYNIPINEWTRFFKYYRGNVQRRFNPVYIKGRCELNYSSRDDIKTITKIFAFPGAISSDILLYVRDGTKCDDCRCEELRKYVVPYFCACETGKMHVLK